jgi:hypothetical protein
MSTNIGNLKRALAEHGFESNEDFGFEMRCVFQSQQKSLRAVHVAGSLGRRKTAFAQALGAALGFAHRLYFDFLRPPEVRAPTLAIDDPHDAPASKPLSALDRIVLESCAYSEAARTVLTLDQLQASSFTDQERLCQFVLTHHWQAADSEVRAYSRNFLLLLISEAPLYHGLRKASFRVQTDPVAAGEALRAAELGLPASAQALLDALAALHLVLNTAPTASEWQLLLSDLEARVRTLDQLKRALFGRIELLSWESLCEASVTPYLERVLAELGGLLGIEEIDLSAPSEIL